MPGPIDQIENRIEQLIKGSLSRIFGAEISPTTVATQLARAMHEGVRKNEEGKPFAPDKYALTFHPEDAQVLIDEAPEIPQELSKGLLDAARQCDYLLFREPIITLAADPTLSLQQVRVIAWHSTSPLEFTQAMPRRPQTQPGAIPRGAYLIVEGQRHFSLDRIKINVGRRLDNQMILDDIRVSRTHAQLRVRKGRFVLFDLGSTAGTWVNGRRVKQHILQPGDVISIAGVRLVYGEDPGGPPDETPAYSPPFPPRPAGDQPTRAVDRDLDPDE